LALGDRSTWTQLAQGTIPASGVALLFYRVTETDTIGWVGRFRATGETYTMKASGKQRTQARRPESAPEVAPLSHRNSEAVGVIARNEVTPAHRRAIAELARQRSKKFGYPITGVWKRKIKTILKWIIGWERRTEAEKLRLRRFYHLPRTLWGAYQAAMADPIVGFEAFRHLTDEAWIDTIIKSVSTPIIEGVRFAGFPDEPFKKGSGFVATTEALRDAGQFYCDVKKFAAQLSVSISNARILDFGVGWGRHARFFARDTVFGNIYGVDVWPLMIELCRTSMVPASVSPIEPLGQLPYRDQFFDIVYAFSVFTHLPQIIGDHWLKEIRRVMRPRGLMVMTVNPPRFVDFCHSLQAGDASLWHQALRDAIARVPDAAARVRTGEFLYLPTGGGGILTNEIYGDAIIPEAYIQKNWTHHFDLIDYLDDPQQFWAIVVLQNK
jgi:ubiquinone/menaquinone biosynthesis C-methylase UbiE